MKHPKRKLIRVEVKNLKIHPSAQRLHSPAKVKALVEAFDLDAIGTIHAVECTIGGVHGIWVIDGQHRVLALLEIGFGEYPVDVYIHQDVQTEPQACDKFLKLNKRAQVNPFDTFLNEVHANHPASVGAMRCLEERKLAVARTTADGRLSCVRTLTALYNADEGKSLKLTLDTVLSAWGSIASAIEGKVIEGIGLVYRTYNGTVDQPTLVKKLAKYPGGPSALLGDAKGIRTHRNVALSRAVGECIVETYNVGRRSGRLDRL
jgi:hypothetical protein